MRNAGRLGCQSLCLLFVLAGCGGGPGDERAHWVGPFGDGKSQPSAASLEESRKLDEIRQLVDDGLYDQARVKLDALLATNAVQPQAFFLKAQLHRQQGEHEQALPWCDRAIAASPYWIEPRVALAQSYLKLKRLAAAENVFGDLDRLAPKMAWGPYGMGAIAGMRGDLKRATTLIDEALSRDPRHAPSLRVRANLAAQSGDAEFEERLLGRYLAEVPSASWAHARLGELAVSANHLEDARIDFLHAYELQPDATTARRLAELAQRRDDHTEARLWQERAGTLPANAKPKQADPEGP